MIKIADSDFKSHLKSLEVNEDGDTEKKMAKRSPESRARIEARTAEIRQEITLARQREELNVSQAQLVTDLVVK